MHTGFCTVLLIVAAVSACDTAKTATEEAPAVEASALGDQVKRMRAAESAPTLLDAKTRTELEARLHEIWELDQTVRMGASATAAGWMQEVDEAHTAELAAFVKVNGWPRLSEHGETICEKAWLIAQHSDRDLAFQKDILSRMEALPSQEVVLANYAYLWDRVAVAEDRPQRFGTQGGCVGNGLWAPRAGEDEESLDARRASMGLRPIAEYIQTFELLCRGED